MDFVLLFICKTIRLYYLGSSKTPLLLITRWYQFTLSTIVYKTIYFSDYILRFFLAKERPVSDLLIAENTYRLIGRTNKNDF